MKRTLNADTTKYIGERVRLCGWVQTIRSHGKLIFTDLRDRTGLVQVVFNPRFSSSAPAPEIVKMPEENIYETASALRPEWVIEVIGTVNRRPKGMENPRIATGGIEISADELKIYSQAKTLPFSVETSGYELNEEIRLKYRYLDLRRERLVKNLTARQKTYQFIRGFLIKEGFLEIETPILTKSTPEGARDFLVPSRLSAGKFYALPQSPQQYKQLLMVAGVERYFQIVRCFRDEDPRADRQPEFTQLDLEMSFVEEKDILDITERLYFELVKKIFPLKRIPRFPFPRLAYKKVMEEYKTDKPDLRKNKSDPNELAFAFVVDFPMFEWKAEENPSTGSGQGRWDAVHHPFTRPKTEDIGKIKKEPNGLLAFQYDLVLNGYEIAGGSLRSYKPEILEAVFEVMGHKKQDIRKKFGHLLEAFEYGVPPHGGIGHGIDRFFAVVLNEPNIREVVAFPKTGDNRDLMMDVPSEVEPSQLKELHIKTTR